ncbi:MAG: glycogen debranching enzyme N-terminal domain-containing protein [Candidatus Aenigmarchaeota archaeon]|nr:glycogen debranching enzyme N-terminal domain-containing protein [Candidatus Aenigmarchaeota archaeon]
MLPKIVIENPDFKKDKKLEWIITNGLGGYASSTIFSMNTRKYHGLLVAGDSIKNRMVLLSNFQEEIVFDSKSFEISTNRYSDVYHPEGYKFLEKFELNPFPKFFFKINGKTVTKQIYMFNGINAVSVVYEIEPEMKLLLRPLIAFRSMYGINGGMKTFNEVSDKNSIKIFSGKDFLNIWSNDFTFNNINLEQSKKWYWNFLYEVDSERGEECIEHLYNPGFFVTEKKTATITADFNFDKFDVSNEIKKELKRKKNVIQNFFKNSKLKKDEWIKWLVLSADNHVVKSNGHTSIIAGYHWFGEWGRDTFISLPGLCLSTKRYSEARDIIKYYISKLKFGLIPNEVDENYNSADASLWLINAVYDYYQHTEDIEFVMQIYEKLRSIISFYMNGTNGIKMDDDFLIYSKAGMTWMDAFVDGKYATAREGKAVEVQALWYNALKIMEFFSKKIDGKSFSSYSVFAEKVRESFIKKFWNGEYLNDTDKSNEIRPNQIIAFSLPFSMINGEMKQNIIKIVNEKLMTRFGLRTLNKEDNKFVANYSGSFKQRDLAYHNGTIWPWMYGLFTRDEDKLKEFVEREINRYGLGCISEIIDADEPFESKGCISQAWSVATILQAITEKNFL